MTTRRTSQRGPSNDRPKPARRAKGGNRRKRFEVTYATSSKVVSVRQPALTEEPPEGFETGVCLLPVASPTDARIKPTPWCVRGWLRLGRLAVVSAAPKNLKSYWSRQVALSVASGLPFLGVYAVHDTVRGRPVVVVCAEEECNDVLIALHRAALGMGIASEAFGKLPIWLLPAIGRDLFERDPAAGSVVPSETYHAVQRACEEVGAALIVFDTLIGVKGAARENSNDDMRDAFAQFRLLGKQLGATVVVVDHEGHDETDVRGNSQARRRPRGASDKLGAVDDIISLSKKERTEGTCEVDAWLRYRSAGEQGRKFTVIFSGETGPIHLIDPGAPITAATLPDDGKKLLKLVATGKVHSKRKVQAALDLKSPAQMMALSDRYKSLVEWESHGRGKPDVPTLTKEGQKLAGELGFSVLTEGSAHDATE